MVPVEFCKLVDRLVDDGQLRSEIELLVQRKKRGLEKEKAPAIAVLDGFIDEAFEAFAVESVEIPERRPDLEKLNTLFRASVLGRSRSIANGDA